jgi:RTX calcium-binding nonapeptide repeat (4 copies)
VRRLSTSALTLVAVLFALAETAPAATIRGTSRADRLVGTPRPDTVFGLAGGDSVDGRAGADFLDGGRGVDLLAGGRGNDRVSAEMDGAIDTVTCGAGRDVVTADLADRVARDCETISRQLSRDPYRNADSQHETQVEPDSFAFGSTIVTTFQSGRYFDGGASNIGFATSTDGGRTWTSGFLPGLTIFSSPPGRAARVSDPVVAYDAVHGVWLIASLAVSPAVSELFVSRSTDGLTWSPPVTAARAVTAFLAYDKEWIACDNWPTSRFRGRCYLSFTDLVNRALSTQSSSDGGLTWTPPVPGPRLPTVGAQPVAQPDGTLVIVYIGVDAIDVVRSLDGGASFTASATISEVVEREVPLMRAPPLPSVEADASGRIFVAWHDCRFRVPCRGNDIVFSSSSDGISWTQPARVPISPASSPATYFVPGLAVDPSTSGSSGRIAIAYHAMPTAACFLACRVDVGLIVSATGGASWRAAERLNAQSMLVPWIADTNSGRMTGDYISTSFVDGIPIPVFSLASEPAGLGRFRQAIFARQPR